MSVPQLPSSTSYSETDSGYAADSSASSSSSEAPAAIPDGFGDSGSESEDWPSSDSDCSIWGRNALNADGSIHGPDLEVEVVEDSGYQAEEGWRSESPSCEEDSSSQKPASVEEMDASSASSSSSSEGADEPEVKMVEDSQTVSRGVKRGREDDAEGSSKRARAA